MAYYVKTQVELKIFQNEGFNEVLSHLVPFLGQDDPVIRQKVRDFAVAYNEPMDPAVSGGTQVIYAGGRGETQEVQWNDWVSKMAKPV